MDINDIINLRLANQQINQSQFDNPDKLLRHMGAVQAQDLEMAKRALGVRLPGSKVDDIEDALNKGKILRTHVLRPTWHFVPANDIRWMLELTAPHIKSSIRSRHKQLGITDKIVDQSQTLIRDLLDGKEDLSRADLIEEMKSKFSFTNKQAYIHLMMLAELDGVLCSGHLSGNNQTYSLLSRRMPDSLLLSREEGLARLAYTYFTSHGPATLQDFVWWSGLPVKDARKAIELNEEYFASAEVNSILYWFPYGLSAVEQDQKRVSLLPAYDEFIISYKDRTIYFSSPDWRKVISSNGIFRPVVLIDGKVAGIWSRKTNKSGKEVQISLFNKIDVKTKRLIEKEVLAYALFLGKNIVLKW